MLNNFYVKLRYEQIEKGIQIPLCMKLNSHRGKHSLNIINAAIREHTVQALRFFMLYFFLLPSWRWGKFIQTMRTVPHKSKEIINKSRARFQSLCPSKKYIIHHMHTVYSFLSLIYKTNKQWPNNYYSQYNRFSNKNRYFISTPFSITQQFQFSNMGSKVQVKFHL